MNRSKKIDLAVSTITLALKSIRDTLDNTKLDVVHKAATEANFVELVAAIESYWERYTLTSDEWSECQKQSIIEQFGDSGNDN